jgi:hypothetical protein
MTLARPERQAGDQPQMGRSGRGPGAVGPARTFGSRLGSDRTTLNRHPSPTVWSISTDARKLSHVFTTQSNRVWRRISGESAR